MNNDNYVVNSANSFDEHYVKLLNKNKLNLRKDGIIVYMNKQIVMPPDLRISFIQICHVFLQHKGVNQSYNYIKGLIYCPGLIDDIAFYIERCPCQLFNKKRRDKYNIDKGPMSPYIVRAQNKMGFMDLFGPMHDGKYISILIDMFDDYLDLNVGSPTALDISKKVVLRWNYTEGVFERIYNDKGSYYTSKLMAIYKYIMGTQNLKIIGFNPWINFAESQMKAVNKSLSINKFAYDNYLVNNLYMKLMSLNNDKKYMEYKNYIDPMKFAHNIQISPKTGKSAFEVRRAYPYYSSILEMGLKLERGRRLNMRDYCINGIVDYDKFVKLLKNSYDITFKEAIGSRIEYEKKRQLLYNTIPSTSYKINDYVIYQPVDDVINKQTPNEYYGWVVKEVKIPGKNYVIQNIFDRDHIIKDVTHGHLRPFYKPIWLDPMMALDGPLLRIDKLDRKEEEIDFKEFTGDELQVEKLDINKLNVISDDIVHYYDELNPRQFMVKVNELLCINKKYNNINENIEICSCYFNPSKDNDV